MAYDESIKRAFSEWLALTPSERSQRALPSSQAKWAEAYGLTAKTLARWKKDPTVIALKNHALARQQPPEAAVDPEASPIEQFDAIRHSLTAKALKGDEKATSLYFQHIGRDLLEQERKAREAGLLEKTDEELVVEILDMVGPRAVRAWLEGQNA